MAAEVYVAPDTMAADGGRSREPDDLLPVLQRRGDDRLARGGRARRRDGVRAGLRDPRRGRRLDRTTAPRSSRRSRSAYPELRVVYHGANRGYGAALRSGFADATKDLVFYTDGDGQYDVLELKRFLPVLQEGVDVVNGYKIARSDPFHRIVIGKVYLVLMRVLFRFHVRDVDCDFRLIRRVGLERDLAQALERRHLPRAREEARARRLPLRGLPGPPLSPGRAGGRSSSTSAGSSRRREHPAALVGDPRHARHAAQRGARVPGRPGRGELGESPAVTAEVVPFLDLSRAAAEESESARDRASRVRAARAVRPRRRGRGVRARVGGLLRGRRSPSRARAARTRSRSRSARSASGPATRCSRSR